MTYGPPQSAYTSETPNAGTDSPNWSVGADITFAVAGRVTALRFYRHASGGGTSRTLKIYTTAGVELVSAATSGDSGTGWRTATLGAPYLVTAGQTFRVVLDNPNGFLAYRNGTTPPTIVNGDLTVAVDGYFKIPTGFPTTAAGANYYLDVIFEAEIAATMAITATPDPVHARIRLQVTDAADGVVTIRRADSNGVHTVRQYEDQVSAAGLLDLHDYEAALTGPITYTATDHLGNVATVTLDAGMGDDGEGADGPWLSHPNLPALNTRVRIIEDLPTFNRRSTEHVIYGRAAPVYTTQPLQTRTGTLSLLCTSWDEWRQIHGLYKSGNAVLLRNTCLTDADYYHVGDLTPAPTVPSSWQGNWRVDIAYTAVDQPEGALVGTVEWSWINTVAAHDTWADVLAAYDTWAELVMGPTP